MKTILAVLISVYLLDGVNGRPDEDEIAAESINSPTRSKSGVCPPVDYCVIGRLYTAIQGAAAEQCKSCSAYLQCVGSQQAMNYCHRPAVSDETERIRRSSNEANSTGATQKRPNDFTDLYEEDEDNLAGAVQAVTSSIEWEEYLFNELGIEVNQRANEHGRQGKNCFALYGMFRGCVIPTLCLGYAGA